MKTIELTDEQYALLLSYKNYVSMKTRQITNKEALQNWENREEIATVLDFETGYSFGQCIQDTINSIMDEQVTGEVNYIT